MISAILRNDFVKLPKVVFYSSIAMNNSSSIAMTTISTENNYLTLINIFTVNPADQQQLIDLLIQATQIVKEQPGFISSSLHRSLDGGKVTMYAQWESIDHYNQMRSNSSASPFLEQAMKISSFEPGMYEVVASFTPSS
jgi:quinol monooxygenase YgiN